jgi:hypothetical protein
VVTSDSPELREAGGNDAIYVAPTEDGVIGGILAALCSGKNGLFDWRKQSWLASSAILAEAMTGENVSQSAAAG